MPATSTARHIKRACGDVAGRGCVDRFEHAAEYYDLRRRFLVDCAGELSRLSAVIS